MFPKSHVKKLILTFLPTYVRRTFLSRLFMVTKGLREWKPKYFERMSW